MALYSLHHSHSLSPAESIMQVGMATLAPTAQTGQDFPGLQIDQPQFYPKETQGRRINITHRPRGPQSLQVQVSPPIGLNQSSGHCARWESAPQAFETKPEVPHIKLPPRSQSGACDKPSSGWGFALILPIPGCQTQIELGRTQADLSKTQTNPTPDQ